MFVFLQQQTLRRRLGVSKNVFKSPVTLAATVLRLCGSGNIYLLFIVVALFVGLCVWSLF